MREEDEVVGKRVWVVLGKNDTHEKRSAGDADIILGGSKRWGGRQNLGVELRGLSLGQIKRKREGGGQEEEEDEEEEEEGWGRRSGREKRAETRETRERRREERGGEGKREAREESLTTAKENASKGNGFFFPSNHHHFFFPFHLSSACFFPRKTHGPSFTLESMRVLLLCP